jgi:hypothetical protein
MARTPYNPTMGQSIKSAAGQTDKGFIAHYVIAAADAVAAAVNAIAPVTALADGLTTTLTTADIDQPTTPRVLNVTGNAASAVGDVVITGTDASGAVLVETITSTGAATVAGTKAFASVSTIVLPARGAGGDTIAVGATGAFGLPFRLPHDTVIKILNNNTATTVASGSFSATVLADNFITPTAALAANQVDVYLIV